MNLTCAQTEPLFTEYLDGLLSPTNSLAMDAHLASCPACRAMAEDMRLAMRFTRDAGAVEPPPELIARILEQTTGQKLSGVAAFRLRFADWWSRTMRPVLRPVLEPRFALGMAMTVISCSMLLGLAGVDVRRIKMSDLAPVNLVYNAHRGVALAGAHVVKYYENLRVVYEIQTQLQEMRGPDQGTGQSEPAPAPSKPKPGTSPRSGPGSVPDKRNDNHSDWYYRRRNVEAS